MILLVATLLVAASGYAESKDSLKVENVMSVENPERVTITESDNRLMVEIDGKKDNPSFRYVREVEISPSDVSVTKERSGNWDFNIPFIIRKSKFPQNPKRSVRFSGKRTKRSVQKRKARNTQKAETKVL